MDIIVTVNKNLVNLTDHDIERIGEMYLKGWHDLSEYGFRIKGFNNTRVSRGYPALDTNKSILYRIDLIQENYTYDEIKQTIQNYMMDNLMADARWTGIELFGCRFGREYVKVFKTLLGADVYKDIAESSRVSKLTETQIDLYGGVGLAGEQAKDKALQTNIKTRGVSNPMHDPKVKKSLRVTNQAKYGGPSPFSSPEIRRKAEKVRLVNVLDAMVTWKKDGLINNRIFKGAPSEMIVFYELVQRFGKDDVYYQYGKHPYDKRYPYNCDFYIKSLDLFIEINAHYSHGGHWYDDGNHDDRLRVKHLVSSGKKRNVSAIDVWTRTDVEKRAKAKQEGLNYLVFWDSSIHRENKKVVPNLFDFYEWLYDYDTNTDKFLKDNPKNTY